MSKRNDNLRVLLLQYVQSILEMANSVDAKNINQIISPIKANIRVSKHETQDFNHRDYD